MKIIKKLLVIIPVICGIALFAFMKMNKKIDEGYETAIKEVDEMLEKLNGGKNDKDCYQKQYIEETLKEIDEALKEISKKEKKV